MESLLQDVRYAARGLVRTPGFTAVVLLTLAIGTGANATVFSFVNALLLRPASAVADPGRLVAVYTADFSSGPFGQNSYPDFLSLRQHVNSFASLAVYADSGVSALRVGETIERVRAARVSGEFFSTLGVTAAAGRLLAPPDAQPDAPATAVISYDLWQRAFGSAQNSVGARAQITGEPMTIVGVAPAGFHGLDLGHTYDVWMPQIPITDEAARGSRVFAIAGRLRPGVAIDQAQAQVTGLAAQLAHAYPSTNRGTLRQPNEPRPMLVVRHTRLPAAFRGEVSMVSAVILAAVLIVLLIACANVSALLLSRATVRARETALRLALGAGRRRLMRQVLVEHLLLGMLAAALGLLFALWTADVLPSFFPAEQARQLDARLDARVIGFTLLVGLLSSIIFGLAPAVQATRPAAANALRSNGSRTGEPRGGLRLRRTLVASQIALAFVLLTSAGLLVRSLSNALAADPGFSTRDAVIASLEIPDALSPAAIDAYVDRLLDRVTGVPGVRSAALTMVLPFGGGSRRGFDIEGYQRRPGEGRELNFNIVTPGYFHTLGIPLVRGRFFDRRDGPHAERVAVVNLPLAERYFGGAALGRTLHDSRGATVRIVGVVGPGPSRGVHETPVPTVYYPLSQETRRRLALVAHTSGDASPLVDPIRRQTLAVDARVPAFRVMTLAALLDQALTTDRLAATLVSTAAAMALVLAVIGIYGVIAYSVARRAREIGVRVALGATSRDVIRMVVAEGLGVTIAGVIVGGIAAQFAARALQAMMTGVSTGDTTTFASVPVVLGITALTAAVVPAWRAVRLDPAIILRAE